MRSGLRLQGIRGSSVIAYGDRDSGYAAQRRLSCSNSPLERERHRDRELSPEGLGSGTLEEQCRHLAKIDSELRCGDVEALSGSELHIQSC